MYEKDTLRSAPRDRVNYLITPRRIRFVYSEALAGHAGEKQR
jgi:hypothetical protein